MEPRHRAWLDPPLQARTHHQVVAGAELIDEALEIGQIIRRVGIRHDDEAAARLLDATAQRGPVAAARFP